MTKKQIASTLKLAVISWFGIGLFVSAPPVQALECGVLPQSLCNSAEEGELEGSGIWGLLVLVIQIMTIGIGVVAVAALTYAGFLYTSAQDSAEQTKKAKDMILNTVIGLVAYALMFSLLQFLVPGGIF